MSILPANWPEPRPKSKVPTDNRYSYEMLALDRNNDILLVNWLSVWAQHGSPPLWAVPSQTVFAPLEATLRQRPVEDIADFVGVLDRCVALADGCSTIPQASKALAIEYLRVLVTHEELVEDVSNKITRGARTLQEVADIARLAREIQSAARMRSGTEFKTLECYYAIDNFFADEKPN